MMANIVAMFHSTLHMDDGYVNHIAIVQDVDGYHNHFLYDARHGGISNTKSRSDILMLSIMNWLL